MTEVGLTPMQIIQGSTKCPAELVQKQDSLGTVEAGKIADILIVDADPLQDIENIKKTSTVIFDGKAIDRRYHANYTTTFNPPGDQPSPAVEGLQWVVALMKVGRGGGPAAEGEGRGAATPVGDPASSPQPAIQNFDPYIVTQSTPSSTPATITVKGINFVRRSMVHFKGKPVPTEVVSPTEIRFTLDAEALRTPGRFEFVVVNPAPVAPLFTKGMWGNGTSNLARLIVNYKYGPSGISVGHNDRADSRGRLRGPRTWVGGLLGGGLNSRCPVDRTLRRRSACRTPSCSRRFWGSPRRGTWCAWS